MPPQAVAGLGIARTFQNIELFEHATVLHNLLIGRHTQQQDRFLARPVVHRHVPARRNCSRAQKVEEVIDFLDLAALPGHHGGRTALRRAQGGGAGTRPVHRAPPAAAGRTIVRA
jgi:ABC-type branched-subunit amino acid transport system ATPase component